MSSIFPKLLALQPAPSNPLMMCVCVCCTLRANNCHVVKKELSRPKHTVAAVHRITI